MPGGGSTPVRGSWDAIADAESPPAPAIDRVTEGSSRVPGWQHAGVRLVELRRPGRPQVPENAESPPAPAVDRVRRALLVCGASSGRV